MSADKHTPGPWRDEGIKTIRAGKRDTTHLISTDNPQALIVATSDTEANARLIAAAPDLLAALERLIEPFDMPISKGDVSRLRLTTTFKGENVQSARAAIAKAKGAQ